MPITYTDKMLEEKDYHPLLTVKPDSDMVRYGKDGKSVFAWNRDEALAMYKWYVDKYSNSYIEDEFGNHISRYNWTELINTSYYTTYPDEEPSELTIKERWLTELVQKQAEACINPDINGMLEEDDDDES